MFVEFQYTLRDREETIDECTVLIDTEKTILIGRQERMIYNQLPRGYKKVTALFINYNGTEYGNKTMTDMEFRENYCNQGVGSRIFEDQFEDEFE